MIGNINSRTRIIRGEITGVGRITGGFSNGGSRGSSAEIDYEKIRQYIEQYIPLYITQHAEQYAEQYVPPVIEVEVPPIINERIALVKYLLDIEVNNDGSVRALKSSYDSDLTFVFDTYIGDDGTIAVIK